jgi:hypothetical protein
MLKDINFKLNTAMGKTIFKSRKREKKDRNLRGEKRS